MKYKIDIFAFHVLIQPKTKTNKQQSIFRTIGVYYVLNCIT